MLSTLLSLCYLTPFTLMKNSSQDPRCIMHQKLYYVNRNEPNWVYAMFPIFTFLVETHLGEVDTHAARQRFRGERRAWKHAPGGLE